MGIKFHYFLIRYYSIEEINNRKVVNILIYRRYKNEKSRND